MTQPVKTNGDCTSKRPQIGAFILSHDPTIVRVAVTAGLDFLIIDAEHGLFSPELLATFIDATTGLNISLFVRCTASQLSGVNALFDHGLEGVLVAGVSTIADIQSVLDHLKYPPLGQRGLNPFVPSADFGNMKQEVFMTEQNARTNVWVLAENQQLLCDLEQICHLPGLDGLFFGPYDLSIDLGIPSQTTHQRVLDEISNACDTAKRHRIKTGIFAADPTSLSRWKDLEFNLLAVGFDWSTLRHAWTESVLQCRDAN